MRDDLNDWKEWECPMASGSSFKVDHGPWHEKECCPQILVQKDGIIKMCVRRRTNYKVFRMVCTVEEAKKDIENQNHSQI